MPMLFRLKCLRRCSPVYLDAVTVTGVGQHKYQPQSYMEALSDTQRYRRIYEPGEAFDLTTYVRNDSAEGGM